jgi:hypothetical protein
MKKTLLRVLASLLGVALLLTIVGFLSFPRAQLPIPAEEGTCARYGIRFDTTSIESIYLDPESILLDPDAFLEEDPAYQLLAKSRARGAARFRPEAWVKDIERLASLSSERRQQQRAFRLSELIIANQESFCREVGPHVLAYLPEGADLGATIYLTALDEPVPAFAGEQEVAFSLSHPLFAYASVLHEPTALSTFCNLGLQELFHIGFSNTKKPISLEEHMENEVAIDMLLALQNEGIATHIEHRLSEQYPSPFEWFLNLIDRERVVRWYIHGINELLAVAVTQPTGEAYEDIYRRIGSLGYRRKGFYVVGAHMAATIEREQGRQALVQTIVDGYDAFADTYNGVVDEDMRVRWRPEP